VARPRDQLIANLESLYKESYARAQAAGDQAEMARLDFAFRRDQLYLEAILDVRDGMASLAVMPAAAVAPATPAQGEKSVMEQISDLRGMARNPFGR
jgi:hypothetical protein